MSIEKHSFPIRVLRKVIGWVVMMFIFCLWTFIYAPICFAPFIVIMIIALIPFWYMSAQGTEESSIYITAMVVGGMVVLGGKHILNFWLHWHETIARPLEKRLEVALEKVSDWGGFSRF